LRREKAQVNILWNQFVGHDLFSLSPVQKASSHQPRHPYHEWRCNSAKPQERATAGELDRGSGSGISARISRNGRRPVDIRIAPLCYSSNLCYRQNPALNAGSEIDAR
jgi:hypothetical protein